MDKPIPKDLTDEFLRGVSFADGRRFLPAKLEITGKTSARVTICEGKYHQIKLMFARYGLTVTKLKRTVFGGLVLDSTLKEGQSRLLTNDERASLNNQKIHNI